MRTEPPPIDRHDRLSALVGAEPGRAPAFSLELDGVRYRISPLAAHGGRAALLCESPPRVPLPPYRARRALRQLLPPRLEGRDLAFTDAAHSALVWSRVERGTGGRSAYRERLVAPGAPAVRTPVPRTALRPAGGFRRVPPAPTGVLPALLRRLARSGVTLLPLDASGAGELPEVVCGAVEALEDPGVAHALWRAMLELRVLDPRCGAGRWLLAVAGELEPVADALLERMGSWVIDETLAGGRVRASLPGLFRRLLDRAEAAGGEAGRTRFVRQLLVLHTLHGVEPDPERARRCRLRLQRFAGDGGDGGLFSAALTSVAVGTPDRGAAGEPDGPLAEGRREEAEIAARAADRLRRLWLAGAAPALLEGGWLERRRRLDALHAAGWEGRSGAGPRLLDPRVEFHDVLARGGFDLVREGSR